VKNLPADFYFTGNIFMIENGVVVEIHGLASSVISDPISVISELTMDDFDENSSAKKKRKAKFVG
jgi:hypothetical protein